MILSLTIKVAFYFLKKLCESLIKAICIHNKFRSSLYLFNNSICKTHLRDHPSMLYLLLFRVIFASAKLNKFCKIKYNHFVFIT